MINHLGIIMDGNRRWAKSKFLPAIAGHKAGADNVVKMSELASEKGIKYLTLWALSKDNLAKRDKKEIEAIIKLINNIESYLDDMIKKGLRFDVIGNISELPEESQIILNRVKEKTKNNKGLYLTIALIYGGQDEIIRGIKKLVANGEDINKLDTNNFRKHLDTGKLPIIDLIVRTGGDIRHSGFMLYDSEYSEYYFTNKNWPDFNEKELDKVIDFFKGSKRNFGK